MTANLELVATNEAPTVENIVHMLDTDGDVYTLAITDGELEIRIDDDPVAGPGYSFKPRREDLATLALWAVSSLTKENFNGLFEAGTDRIVGYKAADEAFGFIESYLPFTEEEGHVLTLAVTADLAVLATHWNGKREAAEAAAEEPILRAA